MNSSLLREKAMPNLECGTMTIAQLATVVFVVYALIAIAWFISFRPITWRDVPSCVFMALFWPVAVVDFLINLGRSIDE